MVKSKIYRVQLVYGRNIGWYEAYIHLSIQHKLLLPYFKSKSVWYLVIYIHLQQHILRNYNSKSGWSQKTYAHDLYGYLRKSAWYQYTYFHVFPDPKTPFFFGHFITVVTTVLVRMSGLMRPIS